MTVPVPAGLTLRTLLPDDFDQVQDLDDLVFNQPPSSPRSRELHRDIHRLEYGRGTGVFDGAELVGVGTLDGFTMSVPGGLAPMAAVLFIGVKPTHTRRGIMRTLISSQLQTLHEQRLEPVAALTASEAGIYGRFGYAQASYAATFTVPKQRSALRPVAGAGGLQLRLVPTADSVEACERIVARQLGIRAGMLAREAAWAEAYAADLEEWRSGRSALRTVLALRAGEPAGFARYRSKDEYGEDGLASGYTDVSEIYADDVAAFAALARYLLDLDLTGGVTFRRQPVDAPLVHLLTDFRAAQMRIKDAMYLRIVDVDRALALRTYSAPAEVVLEITDELCPWNAGRWRLAGDEKSATCVRDADADPDLALDIRELAAAYLGGSTLAALAQAGLIRELRPGALTEASRAFATDLAPWLQFGI